MPKSNPTLPLTSFGSFGELLKYLRRRARLSQRELSIAVGYSESQISRLENNQSAPDPATLAALFVPALLLEDEPETAARLLELATTVRGVPASERAGDITSDLSRHTAPAWLTNLPIQLTSFVGREKEIAEVKRLLLATRLLTLTGPGGTGKTRLAQQVAAQVLDAFANGVWLVELAPVANPAIVIQTVATTLEVREEPGRPLLTTLLSHLRAKNLLLILDNCEHLIDACAQLAEALLQACPALKILATSREGLGITGETCFQVPSLSVPDLSQSPKLEALGLSEAVRLFVDRASTALAGFAVSDQNAPVVAQVCRQLDGIPLAIELAAARVKLLTVEQIAARLDDRFQLLTGGSRTALPRHQTLSALINWSYDLLSEPERVLLRRLSVFRGGWTLEAVEYVASDPSLVTPHPSSAEVLDVLTQLVNKSLVVAERTPGEEARYRMLETIRQYAWERLLEADEFKVVKTRHLSYFLKLAEEAEHELHGPRQIAWLKRLEAEHDNLRAAWEWSRADKASEANGLRLAVALFWFWHIRNYMSEGRRWLEEALTQSSVSGRTLTRAKALCVAGGLAYKQSDYPRAWAQLEESTAIFRELGASGRQGLAYVLGMLGELAHYHGSIGQSPSLIQESVAIFREVGDKWGLARSLHFLGVTRDPTHSEGVSRRWSGAITYVPDDPATGRSLYEESLALFREQGDKWAQTFPLGSLGNLAFCQGDRATGRALFEESLAIQREFGDQLGVAWSLWALGNEALDREDYSQTTSLYSESLAIYRGMQHKQGLAALLLNLAEVARRQRDYEQAAKGHEESLIIKRELGNRERIAYSLEGLGRLALSRGEEALAHSLQVQALEIRRESDNPISLAHSLEAFGILAVAHRELERATKLFGVTEPFHPALYHSILPIWRAEHERALAALRAALSAEVFAARWGEGRAMTMEQAVAYALEVT